METLHLHYNNVFFMRNHVNVYLGNATLKKLKDLAEKDDLTLSGVVKYIIISHFKEKESK